jgi:predicted secreted protein
MKWTSILAIYGLFWVMSAFILLPFGVRTHEEEGLEKVLGQADSAPANFRPRRICLIATFLAMILTGLYYANYVSGWIGVDDLNFFGSPPPGADEAPEG